MRQTTLSDYAGEGGFERYLQDLAGSDEFELLKAIALQIAEERGEVTADDLREYCESYGIEIKRDRRIFGAVLAALHREGVLKKAGYVPTRVKSSHGRPIVRFVLSGRRCL